MDYVVEISPVALADLNAAYDWLKERTPQHAPEWYNAALDALLSLETSPARCPFVRQDEDLRQLLFGSKQHAYRIFFKIHGNTVFVHHIRHAARAGGG